MRWLILAIITAVVWAAVFDVMFGCTPILPKPAPRTLRASLPAPTLVPGTKNTWTDGVNTWAGNPWCARAGFLLISGSPAIDKGVNVGLPVDIYGSAPDIGACEYKAAMTPVVPAKPTLNTVK